MDLLGRLINEMLDVTRIHSGNLELYREPFDLRQLVEEVVSGLRLSAPEFAISVHTTNTSAKQEPGISNRQSAPDSSLPVIINADRQRLEQVLTNLVHNAIKYSGDSRKIEVSVAASLAGGEAIIAVRDFGIGVPAQQQSRVFERFFRASNVPAAYLSGLGLGL